MRQKIAIYCRATATDQSCYQQERELRSYAEWADFEVVGVWKEAMGTGKQRPERTRLLTLAGEGNINAILVKDLTQWGRSIQDLVQTVHELQTSQVSLRAHTGMQFDFTSPLGKTMASFITSLAEFERDLLRDRVRTGIAAARARGKTFGRKPGQRPKSDRLAPKVMRLVGEGRSYRYIGQELHLSKNTVMAIVRRFRDDDSERKSAPTDAAI